jgi:hypothetical protein
MASGAAAATMAAFGFVTGLPKLTVLKTKDKKILAQAAAADSGKFTR